MKLVKTLAAATVLAMSSFATQASTINVGGVNWDPDSDLDFSGVSATLVQNIALGSGVVSGYGVVTTINGKGQSQFCPGCQLTFTFGGFTPLNGSTLPVAGQVGAAINYTGGWMKLFVDFTNDILDVNNPNSVNQTNASNGTLWLDLVAHAINDVTFTGFNTTSVTKPAGKPAVVSGSLTGLGQFDVVKTANTAWKNFDTNTRQDGSDLAFTTSFTKLNYTTVKVDGKDQYILSNSSGSGTFNGDTIPTPSSLAVLGLGLLGLIGVSRRKTEA